MLHRPMTPTKHEQSVNKKSKKDSGKNITRAVLARNSETHRLLKWRQSQKRETHKDRKEILKREIWHHNKTGNTNYRPGITRKTGLEQDIILVLMYNVEPLFVLLGRLIAQDCIISHKNITSKSRKHAKVQLLLPFCFWPSVTWLVLITTVLA